MSNNSDQFKSAQPDDGVVLTPNHVSARPTTRADEPAINRFLGGTPWEVFWRLAVASLVVGFFLVWLDIRPYDVFRALDRFALHLWDMGFDAVREIGQYVLAGAAIVLPIWFLTRLVKTSAK